MARYVPYLVKSIDSIWRSLGGKVFGAVEWGNFVFSLGRLVQC